MDWGLIITVIVAIIGSGGFWAFLQKRMDSKGSSKKMLMGLAHDRLRYLSLQYIERGSVTSDEYENLHKYLFLPYKANGGNGLIEKLIMDVQKLPIVDPPNGVPQKKGR